MSGHHKNKGFSQTSKQYDGEIKAHQQQSRNKQVDHSAVARREEEVPATKESRHSSSDFKKGK